MQIIDLTDDERLIRQIAELLVAEFDDERPELQVAIPVIARRLLAGE